jgi:phosphonate transport system substrate-binding protein
MTVALLVAVGMFVWMGEGRAAPQPLVITTLPFDNPGQQKAVFGLLSKRLSEALNRPVRFEVGKSYDDTINKLASGKSDVAFLGAAAYVKARRKGQVRAILRAIRHQHSTYYGIIIVKRGSSIKTLEDLKGKKVAFVDKSSSAGYLYPRLLLASAGLDPAQDIDSVFAGGHHKVVAQVAAGKVDAGACFEGAQDTLEDPEGVVPIARTEPVPGDPVVVRPGLGADLIKKLRSALIEMSTVPKAKPFFTFSEIDGFVPAVDADYDRVAELLRNIK